MASRNGGASLCRTRRAESSSRRESTYRLSAIRSRWFKGGTTRVDADTIRQANWASRGEAQRNVIERSYQQKKSGDSSETSFAVLITKSAPRLLPRVPTPLHSKAEAKSASAARQGCRWSARGSIAHQRCRIPGPMNCEAPQEPRAAGQYRPAAQLALMIAVAISGSRCRWRAIIWRSASISSC